MNEIVREDLSCIIESTADLWEEVRDQNIFITGGTGFFGYWLLESFLHANSELKLNATVYVLTRNPDAFRRRVPHLCANPRLVLYKGDICTFSYPGEHFSHVIHAATVTEDEFGSPSPISIFDRIVQGTRHTLEFARQRSIKKMLFTSSGAVYGKQPTDLLYIPEEYMGAPDPTNEKSAYGEGKRASEFLCSMYSKYFGFEAKIARCFAFVGPDLPLDSNYAIGNFIGNALRNQPIRINGDGTPYRSYLYASDLAIWLWTILFRGQACRPYNVGSDVYLTISELAQSVKEVVACEFNVEIAGKPIVGEPVERYVPLIERCKSELGLRVRVPLREAIRRTAVWYSPYIHKKPKESLGETI